jgi:FkbM family methyltransferase
MSPFNDIREIVALSSGDFESICRMNTANAYMGNNIVLCKVLSKYKMYVDSRDCGIAPHLIMDGYWESWLTQCLAKIIQPGSVCIDIGANFGYYTLMMSELCGKKGRTISIEPNPELCKYLKLSQCIHGWPFEIIEAALSNKKGNTVLIIPVAYPGNASITSPHPLLNGETSKIKVRTLTVDEMVQQLNLPEVDVIKIDVEGAEPLVFEGMQHTIANNPGLQIVMEYSPFIYQDVKKFTDYLFSEFIVYRIKDVAEMTTLDESSISELCQLKDHTDLYLHRKH